MDDGARDYFLQPEIDKSKGRMEMFACSSGKGEHVSLARPRRIARFNSTSTVKVQTTMAHPNHDATIETIAQVVHELVRRGCRSKQSNQRTFGACVDLNEFDDPAFARHSRFSTFSSSSSSSSTSPASSFASDSDSDTSVQTGISEPTLCDSDDDTCHSTVGYAPLDDLCVTRTAKGSPRRIRFASECSSYSDDDPRVEKSNEAHNCRHELESDEEDEDEVVELLHEVGLEDLCLSDHHSAVICEESGNLDSLPSPPPRSFIKTNRFAGRTPNRTCAGSESRRPGKTERSRPARSFRKRRSNCDQPRMQCPTVATIREYLKNMFITAQCSEECNIICLIYVKRLLECAGNYDGLTPRNWKVILMIALLLASKVWDDLSMVNEDFACFLPFSLDQINTWEVRYLSALAFNVRVGAGEYARNYFDLRYLAQLSGHEHLPQRELDMRTAQKLQVLSGTMEKRAKVMHGVPLTPAGSPHGSPESCGPEASPVQGLGSTQRLLRSKSDSGHSLSRLTCRFIVD